jgi:hypothetical protein
MSIHGYCNLCKKEHRLPQGNTGEYGLALMKKLERKKRLDLFSSASEEVYSTESLFGEAGGKMFGVLEGLDETGNRIILYAFSGQFNGHWHIPGWSPPLFEEKIWRQTNEDTEKQIKRISALLVDGPGSSLAIQTLKNKRKKMSQQLMTRLHSLYTIGNFRGRTAPLSSFFSDKRGIPTGAADCCVPKLLNHALQKRITPIGISEFYWGTTNKSGTRRHGFFYPFCIDKCKPLMGFMLCGLAEQQQMQGLHV